MSMQMPPRFLVIGRLQREFVILPDQQVQIDVPAGNALYAAMGLVVWEPTPPPAIVARVGEDYPREWLDEFERHGLDMRGVRILAQPIDLRKFYVYVDRLQRVEEDPVPHFARLGKPFPKALLGYRTLKSQSDSRTQFSSITLRQGDFIPELLDAHIAHICPVDYLTHTLIPAVLRQAGFTTLTVDPSNGTMNPAFWDNIPSLVTGLTAFLPSEEKMVSLFRGRSTDIWQMVEAIASYGCEFIVIKRGARGQYLYDRNSGARWEIPAYPGRITSLTGAGDAFCGGFLAGYQRSFDPVEAVLHGNISASLVIEGGDPFYALGALQGLAEARLAALRESVRRV